MIVAGSSLLYTQQSLPKAVENLANLGFTAVDIGAIEGWAHIDPSTLGDDIAETAEHIETACEAAGVRPVAFNAGMNTDSVDTECTYLRHLATVAERLDIDVITLQGGSPDSDLEADFGRFRDLTESIGSFDVQLTVETHWGTHLEDPAVAATYPKEVPGLGLTLDPGHFAIGPHWDDGFANLLEDVVHVHARQAGDGWENVQRPPDGGKIDFESLLVDLEAVGYDGAVTVEYIDSLDGVAATDAVTWAKQMRELLASQLE